jgi:hypothetical protein
MCIWMSPYPSTAALVAPPAFWKLPKILVVSSREKHSILPCTWGCWPIQDGSHINLKQYKYKVFFIWAVDVHMDESLPLYYHSCWPSFCFWNLLRILVWVLVVSQGANHSVVMCLRLWGSRPIYDGSHINVKHIYGVSQPLYAVDVHIYNSNNNNVWNT